MEFISDNFYAFTGRNREEGVTLQYLLHYIQPDDNSKAVEVLSKLIASTLKASKSNPRRPSETRLNSNG